LKNNQYGIVENIGYLLVLVVVIGLKHRNLPRQFLNQHRHMLFNGGDTGSRNSDNGATGAERDYVEICRLSEKYYRSNQNKFKNINKIVNLK
jgi:hypothetical protein